MTKCLACGGNAICDDDGYQTNFCSQNCVNTIEYNWDKKS